MQTRPTNDVAIVGAAGFVGRVLLRQLQEAGVKATAVVRGAPELAVEGSFHDAMSPSDLAVRGGFDTVINLAYPNSGPPYGYPSQGEAIQRSVVGLVRDGGRVIQVSSLAVFGMALDRPVHLGPVRAVRDHPYVEAKVAAEHGLEREQATNRRFGLDIVRLGNVWGPGSGAWGLPVVQRLVTGRPVGIFGKLGHSNTTDVANVAAYLRFLLADSGASGQDVRYHHLAEFSSIPWRDWVAPVAHVLGVDPVMVADSVLTMPTSGRSELASLVTTPRNIYRNLAGERVSGSVA